MGDKNGRDYSLDELFGEVEGQEEEQGLEPSENQADFVTPESDPANDLGQAFDDASSFENPEEEFAEDINAFATGEIEGGFYGGDEGEADVSEYEEAAPKKKKGLFGRKNKKRKKERQPDFDENEESVYGVQLKPLSEYRKGFNPVTGEFDLVDAGYADLFDDSKKAIDDEVAENFKRIQKERRSRVAEAVQSAGMEKSEIEEELGVAAPMPVSSYSADPYAKQHGIDPDVSSDEDMPEFQRAMINNATNDTMEIKLNVDNDTMELQRVDDDMIDERQTEQAQAQQMAPEEFEDTQVMSDEVAAETDAEVMASPAEEFGNAPDGFREEQIIEGRPQPEIPTVESIYEYRSRGIPTHVINADLLQKAILTEAGEIAPPQQQASPVMDEDVAPTAPIRRQAARPQPKMHTEPFEDLESHNDEMIDDYTGEDDAKSIANELRGDMKDLTLRMLISAACTIALTVINLIFGSVFRSADEIGSAPLIYILMTLLFLGITVAVCFRTILNGLKALFSFSANSDSAVAIATIGVLIQTCASVFFPAEIVQGSVHLYAVILTAILFINAAGKLTMIRRIHSNFRFVNSKEQKYSVRVYDDHNTSLKMVKNSSTDKPALAYQTKTGFLKRFLELSYSPDPAETASQMVAPIALIASLVLCIVCLLLTSSVPMALSALAAALCVSVAAGNMIALNLPMSRLCKKARRAGAMVVGYEGVNSVSGVSSVMVDADDLFPFGTVVINGIKTYGSKVVAEEAIMAASALMNQVGGPLKGVFEQVISENEDSLPEVESFEYEDDRGVVGRVDGKRIFVGNRDLLIGHHLEPPARSDETQYSTGNNQVIYIAVDADVSAMMVLTYSADRRKKNEIMRLEESGVGVVVRTTDPNINPVFLSRIFSIDATSVSILPQELGDIYAGLVKHEVPRSDATIATKGRMESMLSVISACTNMKKEMNLLILLQNIGIILGFVFVAFLACFGVMKSLSSLLLFIFMLFWVLLIIIVPKIKDM